MFDFSKIFIQQTEKLEDSKQVVLVELKDEKYTALDSVHDSLFVSLQSNLNLEHEESVFEKEGKIFVSIKKEHCLQHDIWKGMAELYNKYKKRDTVLVFNGKYANDCVYGFIIKGYVYDYTKKQKDQDVKIKLHAPECKRMIELANYQNFARFLGDCPANHMTPKIMAGYLCDLFSGDKIDIQVLNRNDIAEEQMNLILSVAQGSQEEPVLFHAKFFGRKSKAIDVALVGKGVTFDTGGISLKSAAEMFKLKQDMMGATMCAALLKLTIVLGLEINVTVTLPLVENVPGAAATKPGDVFISKSGKSVEVDNTDAEGRLILADAITYCQKDNPEYLFDVATLTGAVRIALGNVYGGFFTNNDSLAGLIEQCGLETGDPVWRLPLNPIINMQLESHAAELSNSSKEKHGAGGSYAAEFIKEFVNPETKWAHFDISNVRNNHHLKSVFGDQTTARPLPTFLRMMEALEKKSE